MTAQIIDGKAIAVAERQKVAAAARRLKDAHGITPGLAAVLVGDDPASEVYVRNKGRAAREAGLASFEHRLPAGTTEADLVALVRDLNDDATVHGILVQLPLPGPLSSDPVIEAIDPAKDVDGLTQMSAGALATGRPGLRPCTPVGCVILAKSVRPELAGLNALVIGRSILVGKPLAQLLLAENCTVTMAHSKTRDLPGLCRGADLVFAAVGRPEFVEPDWIGDGAVVIDVGINRIPAPERGEGKSRLVGDVAFAGAAERAGAITPVPGGVGPMTIACLLRNTVIAAARASGLEPEL
ncbi:MAG: bifunctional methylenetetrahydrofolate dehydrogenase/methenyltetrahydrofolate cyclohydrolase FolD [Sphingomonadales bacterium]|nr:bifunctional methylenetetrahydrofolate dehydrogenase/methenyltetrahydrofolate cyclohydrolase FolD [Sphingomonadales bacterium]